MKKKYFFFDIDGTLTDDATKQIVPSASYALEELKKAGHFVSIATGRAHYKTMGFAESVNIHNLVCLGGGCLVVNDEIIDTSYLPKEQAIHLIEKAEEDHVGVLMMLDDSIKVYMKNNLFIEQAEERREPTEYILDENINIYDHEYVKLYLSCTAEREKELEWLEGVNKLRLDPEYIVIQFDAKDKGIIRMMEYLNAPLEDVVVFGNDMNDLVMFRDEWTSIAMGNSPDSLKEIATYVTDANIDDGILNACKKYHWIS